MKKKTVLVISSLSFLVIIILAGIIVGRSPKLSSTRGPAGMEPFKGPGISGKTTDDAKTPPHDLRGIYALGTAYLVDNKLDAAITTYQKALAIDSTHGPSLENIGLAYHRKGDNDSALGYLKKALEVIPDSPTLHNTLGTVYRDKKMYPASVNAYKKAMELAPDYYSAYYNIALVYQEMKSREEADAWKRYIEVASKIPSEAQYIEIAKNHLKKVHPQ